MPHRILWSSDHHFGHRAILDERMSVHGPFASIEDHDETLIANGNAAVRPGDTVWHLSNFCYRCPEERAQAIFCRLNGRQLLVCGNHDKVGAHLPWDGPVVDVARTVVPDPATGALLGMFMFYYAYRVWPRVHHGDLHLYGHSHSTLPGTAASADIGVDCFGFRPVTLDETRVRLANITLGVALARTSLVSKFDFGHSCGMA